MAEDLDSFQLDMVVHAFNTSTRKVEDGRDFFEFEANLVYIINSRT